MEEHGGTDKDSHVYQHHVKEGHEIDFDGVKILDRASNDDKLCWKEMLYIRKLKPLFSRIYYLNIYIQL